MELTHLQKRLFFAAAVLFAVGISMEMTDFLSKEGYVQADLIQVNGLNIVLGKGCTAITADTTQERADSISAGLAGEIDGRPNSHDIFVDALKLFNITVDSVLFNRYDGTYYYSDILLTNKEKIVRIDSRPSDAIAIAVRAHAPIYINATLLNEIGKKVC
jgi:bifunctional DNase/RNase